MVFCNSDERLTFLKDLCNYGKLCKNTKEYANANPELAFAEKLLHALISSYQSNFADNLYYTYESESVNPEHTLT